MRCLKSLSSRQKNFLTFGIGFAVGVAVFWILWPTTTEGTVWLLIIPTMFLLTPLSYVKEMLGINVSDIWFMAMAGGIILSLFFLLVKWFFVKLKH